MAAVRREGTAPETALRRALWKSGLRGYRINLRGLPGVPDITFTKGRLAIFVDGAFWHGHPRKFPEAKMTEYWVRKIRRTRERDARVTKQLRNMGWRVVRVWDFEVHKDLRTVIDRISSELGREQ